MAIVEQVRADSAWLREDRLWLRVRDAFAFLNILLEALRRFEFCGLTCGDLDLVTGKLWVVGKGNAKDFVPLPDAAIQLLERWLDLKRARGEAIKADAPLFAATGTGQAGFLSFSALRLRWKQVLRGCGLPPSYGIHSLRHAGGMLVFAQTGSLEKTGRYLRHRSLKTTAEFYLHLDAEELRRDVSKIDLWRTP